LVGGNSDVALSGLQQLVHLFSLASDDQSDSSEKRVNKLVQMNQSIFNLTTNERINWRRYKYLQDDRGRFYNAFDLGCQRNCMEFFHLRRPLAEKDIEFLNISVV